MPGYLTLPGDAEQDYNAYIVKRHAKPLRPGQMSYWQNYGKFHVSLMKAWYGANATPRTTGAYDYLPKLDIPSYDILKVFDMMGQGKVNGYMCQGFNPIAALAGQKPGDGGAGQAEVAGGDGPAGHRNLGVLAKRRAVQRCRNAPTSRPK